MESNQQQQLEPTTQDLVAFTTWEQIEELRRRIREGEAVSRDEYAKALAFFRASRTAAAGTAPKAKRVSNTAAAEAALDALLNS